MQTIHVNKMAMQKVCIAIQCGKLTAIPLVKVNEESKGKMYKAFFATSRETIPCLAIECKV